MDAVPSTEAASIGHFDILSDRLGGCFGGYLALALHRPSRHKVCWKFSLSLLIRSPGQPAPALSSCRPTSPCASFSTPANACLRPPDRASAVCLCCFPHGAVLSKQACMLALGAHWLGSSSGRDNITSLLLHFACLHGTYPPCSPPSFSTPSALPLPACAWNPRIIGMGGLKSSAAQGHLR